MPSTVNPPPRAGSAGIGQAQLARVVRGAQQMRHRAARASPRPGRSARGDALQRPDAADIGDRGGQGDDALGPAQRRGDAVAARRRRRWRPVRCSAARARPASGPVGDDGAQRGRLAHRQVGQERAVAAERAQQRRDRRPRGQARLGAAEFGEALDQPLARRRRRAGSARCAGKTERARRSCAGKAGA